jgi:hypothetical protein
MIVLVASRGPRVATGTGRGRCSQLRGRRAYLSEGVAGRPFVGGSERQCPDQRGFCQRTDVGARPQGGVPPYRIAETGMECHAHDQSRKASTMTSPTERAVLAGGCFWGMQDLSVPQPCAGTRASCAGFTFIPGRGDKAKHGGHGPTGQAMRHSRPAYRHAKGQGEEHPIGEVLGSISATGPCVFGDVGFQPGVPRRDYVRIFWIRCLAGRTP